MRILVPSCAEVMFTPGGHWEFDFAPTHHAVSCCILSEPVPRTFIPYACATEHEVCE